MKVLAIIVIVIAVYLEYMLFMWDMYPEDVLAKTLRQIELPLLTLQTWSSRLLSFQKS